MKFLSVVTGSMFLSLFILQVEYKLGFQVDNFVAMGMPQVNISAQGEVPRTLSGESAKTDLAYCFQPSPSHPYKDSLLSAWLWKVL